MKKTVKSIISIVIAMTVIILSTMTAFAYDEKEFNGRFYDANPINIGEEVYGTITDTNDNDYYWFTIPSDGYVTIKANHTPGTKLKSITLFYYNGEYSTKLLHRELSGGVESVTTPKYGLEAGKYYVRIMGCSYDVPYSFTVNFTQADNWEKEINDSIGSATPMQVNTKFYGASNVSTSEEDWYKFTIEETQMVSVKVWHTFGSDSTKINIYSYNGSSSNDLEHTTVARNSDFGSTEEVRLTAGTYYVRILTGNRQEYQLEVITSDPVSNEAEEESDEAPNAEQPTEPVTEKADYITPEEETNVDIENVDTEPEDVEYADDINDESGYSSGLSFPIITVIVIIVSAVVVIIAAICIVIVFMKKK